MSNYSGSVISLKTDGKRREFAMSYVGAPAATAERHVAYYCMPVPREGGATCRVVTFRDGWAVLRGIVGTVTNHESAMQAEAIWEGRIRYFPTTGDFLHSDDWAVADEPPGAGAEVMKLQGLVASLESALESARGARASDEAKLERQRAQFDAQKVAQEEEWASRLATAVASAVAAETDKASVAEATQAKTWHKRLMEQTAKTADAQVALERSEGLRGQATVECNELNTKSQELVATLAAAKEEAARAEAARTEAAATLAEARTFIDTLTQERDQAIAAAAEANRKAAGGQLRVEELEQVHSELQAELDAALVQRAALESQLEEVRGMLAAAEQEAAYLLATNKEVVGAQEALRASNASSSDETKRATAALVEARNEATASRLRVEELEQAHIGAQADLDALRAQHSTLELQLSEAEKALAECEASQAHAVAVGQGDTPISEGHLLATEDDHRLVVDAAEASHFRARRHNEVSLALVAEPSTSSGPLYLTCSGRAGLYLSSSPIGFVFESHRMRAVDGLGFSSCAGKYVNLGPEGGPPVTVLEATHCEGAYVDLLWRTPDLFVIYLRSAQKPGAVDNVLSVLHLVIAAPTEQRPCPTVIEDQWKVCGAEMLQIHDMLPADLRRAASERSSVWLQLCMSRLLRQRENYYTVAAEKQALKTEQSHAQYRANIQAQDRADAVARINKLELALERSKRHAEEEHHNKIVYLTRDLESARGIICERETTMTKLSAKVDGLSEALTTSQTNQVALHGQIKQNEEKNQRAFADYHAYVQAAVRRLLTHLLMGDGELPDNDLHALLGQSETAMQGWKAPLQALDTCYEALLAIEDGRPAAEEATARLANASRFLRAFGTRLKALFRRAWGWR